MWDEIRGFAAELLFCYYKALEEVVLPKTPAYFLNWTIKLHCILQI